MVPRTVLTRSGLISVNAVRPVNTVQSRTTVNNAGPMKNVINNAYSTTRRPFNKITAANNSNFTKKVNTVKGTRVNTARPKVVISAVKGNKGNAVKASACWLTDESHVLLKVPRKDNMYIVDLKNVVPQGGLTCLFAKATPDESNLWHRRLGHVNFKTMNKLERTQSFLKDQNSQFNQPTITNVTHGFVWPNICKEFNEKDVLPSIENLIDLRVKVIRCDNGTKLKNWVGIRYSEKGQKRSQNRAREGKERKKSKSTKKLTEKSKVKDEANTEEILNGPAHTHLMGRVSPLRYLY
ncbi:putative ribonuclease H-like domain-containing protein [Tanacetum coccineum]